METIKIISGSILLAILYGICHDLITANISVEYFTVGHPKIIESESPVKLALLWGVIATWWVGLILGILVSVAARFGKNSKLEFTEVIRPMIVLIGIMAGSALLAGLLGYILAKQGVFFLVDRLAEKIPSNKHHLFLSVGWTHGASYITGCLGGLILTVKLCRRRKLIKTIT